MQIYNSKLELLLFQTIKFSKQSIDSLMESLSLKEASSLNLDDLDL